MNDTSTLEATWARFLACPRCSGSLRAEPAGAAERLTCTACTAAFPVIDKIPSFVEIQASEQAAEIVQRDAEVMAYESMFLAWEDYLELGPIARDLQPRGGDWVLEVGAGSGRALREYIRRVEGAVAIDFSVESLRFIRKSLALLPAEQKKLVLVHADACALPVKDGAFDRTISLGMLQHLPSADHRARAIAGMARALRPGGRFVMQARHWSRTHELRSRHRDNPLVRKLADLLIRNASGSQGIDRTSAYEDVVLYNTSAEELHDLATRAGIRVKRLFGRIQGVKGIQRLGFARPLVERAVELTGPLSLIASQELIVIGDKPA
jgi:SAM-dependent methyltransferase